MQLLIVVIHSLGETPIPDMTIPKMARYRESKVNGLHWICGYVAKRLRNVQPGLGAFAKNVTREHCSVTFTNRMQRKGVKNGLTIPTKKWFRDFKSIQADFDAYHPKNRLRSGRGVQIHFFNMMVKKFPEYDPKVLWLTTRLLSQFRLRCGIFDFCLLSFPQKERKIYKLRQLAFIFSEGSVFTFQFMDDESAKWNFFM